MSDLRRWAQLDTGGFRFGARARLLTPHEATQAVLRMRRDHTDVELQEIVASGSEDISSLTRAQLWRLVRGEPYESVVTT